MEKRLKEKKMGLTDILIESEKQFKDNMIDLKKIHT